MSPSLRLLVTLVGACMVLAGCSTNEATGRRQFDSLSTSEEVELGNQAKPELVKQYGGEVNSAALRAYVTEIGLALARQTEGENPTLPWEFTVLDSDVINAFALPGGKVFISKALLREFKNEAELAAVLGHEVGHVTAQHVDDRITRAQGVEILAQIAGAAAGYSASELAQLVPTIVGAGGQGYLLKFGRDQESEADSLGLRYMTRAGYDPRGMIAVMEILAAASAGERPMEMLSTHPYPETRLVRIKEELEANYKDEMNNPNLKLNPERFQQNAKPHLAGGARRGVTPAAWCALCQAGGH